MGHADTAVALLAANVTKFPQSARAHYGFGRALNAQGKTELAREQFRTAISIDPSYERARSALEQLR
jgi:Tfp pilus assembly protein PilF